MQTINDIANLFTKYVAPAPAGAEDAGLWTALEMIDIKSIIRGAGLAFITEYSAPLNSLYRDEWGSLTTVNDAPVGKWEVVASREANPKPWIEEPGDSGYEAQYPDELRLEINGETLSIFASGYIPADDDPVEVEA